MQSARFDMTAPSYTASLNSARQAQEASSPMSLATPVAGTRQTGKPTLTDMLSRSEGAVKGTVQFGAHGPFLVVDGFPIGGGLGDITESGVPAMNQAGGHDIRPILPFRKATPTGENGFNRTNIMMKIPNGPLGEDVWFEVWQMVQEYPGELPDGDTKRTKTTCYALKDVVPKDDGRISTAGSKIPANQQFEDGGFFSKHGRSIYLDSTNDQSVAGFTAEVIARLKEGFDDRYVVPKSQNALLYSLSSAALSAFLNEGDDRSNLPNRIGDVEFFVRENSTDAPVESIELFEKAADTIIVNDWSSAPAIEWLRHNSNFSHLNRYEGENYWDKTGHYFFAHNLGYNLPMPVAAVEHALKLPQGSLVPDAQGMYNPLEAGIYHGTHGANANGVFIDRNYADFIINSALHNEGHPWQNMARMLDKAKHNGQVNHSHGIGGQFSHGFVQVSHGLPDDLYPVAANKSIADASMNSKASILWNEAKGDFDGNWGFRQDKPLAQSYSVMTSTMEELLERFRTGDLDEAEKIKLMADLKDFKQENKVALQQEIKQALIDKAVSQGGSADDVTWQVNADIPVLSWVNRLDPWQKGSWLYLASIEPTLNQYIAADNTNADAPKLGPRAPQFLIFGSPPGGDTVMGEYVEQLKAKFPGNVFHFNGFNLEFRNRAFAGSDSVGLPSVYEPFGIVQHQASAGGAIPGPVSWVDGFRSTLIGNESFVDPDGMGADPVSREAQPMRPNNPEIGYQQRDLEMPFAKFMDPQIFPGPTSMEHGGRFFTQAQDFFYGHNGSPDHTHVLDGLNSAGMSTRDAFWKAALREYMRVQNDIIDMVYDDRSTEAKDSTLRQYQYNALRNAVLHQRWMPIASNYYNTVFENRANSAPGTFSAFA